MKNIRVAQSNPSPRSSKSKPTVRVYLDGNLIAEVEIAKRSPISYLKTLKRSKHFKELERQLLPHGITLADIGLGKEDRDCDRD